MAKRKSIKDKQRSTKHTHKTKDRVTRTLLKTGGELRCFGRVCSPCSTNSICRVNQVTNTFYMLCQTIISMIVIFFGWPIVHSTVLSCTCIFKLAYTCISFIHIMCMIMPFILSNINYLQGKCQLPRYNWNTVESGIKHHNLPSYQIYLKTKNLQKFQM